MGPRRGGFLAALVLGSAQVQPPEDIRAAFRMAGFSHALAASGFHLSVLLGSVMMLVRRWPAGKRWPTALRLPSQAKLPSPSARSSGAMAYRCITCSIALEH